MFSDYGGICGRAFIKYDACREALSDHCRSTPGAWPWLVGLYVMAEENSRPEIVCGGALIGDCWILTAAHCVKGRRVLHRLVVTGNSDREINEGTETTYSICNIYVHPLYNELTLEYDVALIKLCCNVSYSAFVRKVCLPDCKRDNYLYRKGTQCTVAGWGATDLDTIGSGLHLSTHLRHFQLPIADRQRCQNSSKFTIRESFLCAGDGSGERGACKGDSGGPLFTEREEGTGQVVIGVVSWGEGCKQAHKYDIFTNICNAKISTWLTEQMTNFPCKHCPDDPSDCSCPQPVVHIV